MRYYFLGICGTAMASLAVLLKQKGHRVWGSDQNIYPPMSDFLQTNRIPVWEGYHTDHLQEPFDLAIIGNALSRGNPEVEEILNRRLPFASLPEVIRREFVQPLKSIVITGTHGKTTTTALMSWILESAGLSPTFLVGGIARNFKSSARLGTGEFFVIEGDEYDSAFFDKLPKFLHYLPYYLIINNIEFDHADIYRDVEQIKDGFRKLIRTVPSRGLIVANGDDAHVRDVLRTTYSRVQWFGRSEEFDWSFGKPEHLPEGTGFTLFRQGKEQAQIQIPLYGEHQVANVLSVIAVAINIGLSVTTIQEGLNRFLNVKRRLEYRGEFRGVPFYDDFAHHPTAIAKTLQALRQHHLDREIIAIFEPRTNTTVKNIFQKQLADALALANTVLLTPIHRAERIPAEQRLSLSRLKQQLQRQDVTVHLLPDYASLWNVLESAIRGKQVIVLMSNGNLGGEYQKIDDQMDNRA